MCKYVCSRVQNATCQMPLTEAMAEAGQCQAASENVLCSGQRPPMINGAIYMFVILGVFDCAISHRKAVRKLCCFPFKES